MTDERHIMTDGTKDFQDILEPLNEQQREAVLSGDGPVLIVAGAGSGKTRVITSKIALLIRQGTNPHEILALTFTNKAAEEMRNRIALMAGEAASGLVMGTFHSVFVRLLREWHSYINFPADFTIYDVEDAMSCLKDCICEVLFGQDWNNKEVLNSLSEEAKKERKRLLSGAYKPQRIAARISSLKNDYIMPGAYKDDEYQQDKDRIEKRERLGEIYELYMKRCRRAGAMDFDDILDYMLYLMENIKPAKESISRRFRYILVDEYQDTNKVQYAIIKIMATAWFNICAVGDDSQSIYAFRGARIQNIMNFKEDFPDFRTYKLETNYRSTPEIVDAANRLIENNNYRIPKTCVANRTYGKPLHVEFLNNDRAEARYIAKAIKTRHEEGHNYSDIAILYRTNAQSRAIEDIMMKEHIPYVIYSGISFFNRQEIKDVLAYMRLVLNPSDDEAFKRICNRPARGISDNTLSIIIAEAAFADLSYTDTAEAILAFPRNDLNKKAIESLQAFMDMMKRFREETKDMNALDAAIYIIKESGIYAFYEDEDLKEEDGQKRTKNIDALIDDIRYYVSDAIEQNPEKEEPGIASYIQNVSLLSAIDTAENKDDNHNKVILMTSHCSKGLEFPIVFIAGVEEGLYPSIRKYDGPSQLEEERRLFYVSITRAKDEVIMTSCANRWKFKEIEECIPSRFIQELIPEDMPEF